MHVVTASDDNYVPGVMGLMASARHYNPAAVFSLIDMGIAAQNLTRLQRMAERLRLGLGIHSVGGARFADIRTRSEYITQAAFLRLLIPDLFPQDDRVLYLDCDILVLGSLEPLWSWPLRDKAIAAVWDGGHTHPGELSSTGIAAKDYINSGVLVMNLPLWREEGLAARCLDFLSDPRVVRYYSDQSAINSICRGRIEYLPAGYNVFSSMLPDWMKRGERPPVILHFAGSSKPWASLPVGHSQWRRQTRKIRDLLPRPVLSMQERLSALERWRRQICGLAIGRKKYWDRLRRERAINLYFASA